MDTTRPWRTSSRQSAPRPRVAPAVADPASAIGVPVLLLTIATTALSMLGIVLALA